jgi:hypothetical protein
MLKLTPESSPYLSCKATLHKGTEYECNWGSLVSIVSDYGLDDRAIVVRSLTEAKDFLSSLCVQTGSEAYPASYPVGTRGPFWGTAPPWHDSDNFTSI